MKPLPTQATPSLWSVVRGQQTIPSRVNVQGRLASHTQVTRAHCSVCILVDKTWLLNRHLVAVDCGLGIYYAQPTPDARHATNPPYTNLNGGRGLVLGKRCKPVGCHVSFVLPKLYVMLT
jgi:hypothetical protein